MEAGLEGVEVERVVEVGAGGAEGFHVGGSLGRVGSGSVVGCRRSSGRRPGRQRTVVGSRHGHPSTSGPATGRRATRRPPGRVSRIRIATISPEAAGQRRDDEDRRPGVDPVRDDPDDDRPDREAEVAPEAVDAGDRAALAGLGDVGDDRDQRRVDHRGPEAEERSPPRSHGTNPVDRRDRRDGDRLDEHPGDDQSLAPDPVRQGPRRDLGDAPRRRVGGGEQADLADRQAGGGLDDRQEPPGQRRR